MDTLTDKQERFAQEVIRLGNLPAAYRNAYDASGMKWTSISVEASRTAAIPYVAARIQELRDKAAAETAIPALAVRIAEMRELETADPTELMTVEVDACRYCHGEGFGWQWIDEMEYAKAFDAARAQEKPGKPPDITGGFGFHPKRGPAPECPRCFGRGVLTAVFKDMAKASRGARRLFKSIKVKGDGSMEILLHDQRQATDMLNRIQGAYKDGYAAQQAPGAEGVQKAASAKTPEERQRAYLRLVSG